jgi:signal transduction histidine kinase
MKTKLPGRRVPITLHRRFLLQNLLLALCLIAIGAVSVWRLGVVRREMDLSPTIYSELRTIGNVGVEVGIVRGLLSDPKWSRDEVVRHLQYAVGGLDQFVQVGQGYGSEGAAGMRESYEPINRAAASARGRLQAVLDRFASGATMSADDTRGAIDRAMKDLDQVDMSCIGFISHHQQTASNDLTATLLLAGLLSLAAVLAAVLLSTSQYRLVMTPLRRLRQGVLRVAKAQFTETLDPAQMGNSAEFLDLAHEFNRMAGELDEFYRRLDQQVRARSRELVRSERLASVGFLAAGVAHEINNPLHIISGYAELTARQLDGICRAPDAAAARQSLRIIREEAFRCKEITERLLDLARGGSDSREPLDLACVAQDVAAMTRGLKRYQDRTVTLNLQAAQPLEVRANRSEMKQVLLNLTLNALEAVPPERGEVRIEGRHTDDWVEMSITDNGRGMAPEVLRHVFEPFFTARRPTTGGFGEDPRGTGLGLSITHAIVESHGGQILAESDGPGLGARFTICLPAGRTARRSPAEALTD